MIQYMRTCGLVLVAIANGGTLYTLTKRQVAPTGLLVCLGLLHCICSQPKREEERKDERREGRGWEGEG